MSGSILNPSLESNLSLVAKVFHRHILHSGGYVIGERSEELLTKFDIDNFISKSYRVSMAVLPMQYGGVFFIQKRKLLTCSVPTVRDIRDFLELIFSKIRLNVQCAIVCLLYCERLMSLSNIGITKRNWRPILLVCLLESSKMWDDLASWNVEFSQLFPIFGTEEINHLEKMFLHEMSYDLFVSGSTYARYYYALRGLRYTSENEIPENYLDIQLKKKSNRQKRSPLLHTSEAELCSRTRPSQDDEKEMLDENKMNPFKAGFVKPALVNRLEMLDDLKLKELGKGRTLPKGYNRQAHLSITRTDLIVIDSMPQIKECSEESF